MDFNESWMSIYLIKLSKHFLIKLTQKSVEVERWVYLRLYLCFPPIMSWGKLNRWKEDRGKERRKKGEIYDFLTRVFFRKLEPFTASKSSLQRNVPNGSLKISLYLLYNFFADKIMELGWLFFTHVYLLMSMLRKGLKIRIKWIFKRQKKAVKWHVFPSF